MRYERDLQVKLQERYRRLYKADMDAFAQEIGYFRKFIQQSSALNAITETITMNDSEFDASQWIEDKFDGRGYAWPGTELQRAKVVWQLINEWADGDDVLQIITCFSSERNINAGLRDVVEKAVEPFVEYLQEQIGSASEILYMLERFKRRLEAFDQAELYEKYKKDTSRGEALYDRYLRRFLFDQGIDYPFSQPASASGEADVVTGLEGDDPLVCEVKLHGAGSYDVLYVAKGFSQAVSYAHDFGKNAAYLVVFNLSDQGLQMPTDDQETRPWPPRLHVEGVTVYVLVVQAKPLPSASKRGKSAPRVVQRDELVRPHPDS